MSLIDPTVSSREARFTPLATGAPLENFGNQRRCDAEGCGSLLSRYNPATTCGAHRGWRVSEPRTRRRS